MGMKAKNSKKAAVKAAAAAAAFTMLLTPVQAMAAEKFDPAFYAATYADVVDALGTDANALYNHYITYGQKEGRLPYAGASGGGRGSRRHCEYYSYSYTDNNINNSRWNCTD